MTELAVVLIVVALVFAWNAGMDTMLWWMRREHPVAFYALHLSMERKKGKKREAER